MPPSSHKLKRPTFRSYKQLLGKKIIRMTTTSLEFQRAGVSTLLSLQLLVILRCVLYHGFFCPVKWALFFSTQQVDCDVNLTDCEIIGFYIKMYRKHINRVGMYMAIQVNINVLWTIWHAEVASSPLTVSLVHFMHPPTMKFYLNALLPVHYEFKK